MIFNIKKINTIFLLFLLCSFSLFAEVINIDKKYPDFDWSEISEQIGYGQFKTVYKGLFEGKERAFVFFNEDELSTVYFSKNSRFHCDYKHRNIIDLFAFSSKQKCLVYELGKDLRDYILENKLELSEKLKLIKDICLGLEYLHKNNVLHRDIKMENVILTFDDKNKITPKIIDFDFYWYKFPPEGMKVNFVCGSFFNMHPVIYMDGFHSFGREIFSLGILIYIILLEEDFYCLYNDFLKKPIVDTESEIAVPKIKPLELKDCYLNKDFQKHVESYIEKLADPFLEATILYCLFNKNPQFNIILYNLEVVIKFLEEIKF
jgi:serine/threonine protein kinase